MYAAKKIFSTKNWATVNFFRDINKRFKKSEGAFYVSRHNKLKLNWLNKPSIINKLYKMPAEQIQYSEKYFDANYEYR